MMDITQLGFPAMPMAFDGGAPNQAAKLPGLAFEDALRGLLEPVVEGGVAVADPSNAGAMARVAERPVDPRLPPKTLAEPVAADELATEPAAGGLALATPATDSAQPLPELAEPSAEVAAQHALSAMLGAPPQLPASPPAASSLARVVHSDAEVAGSPEAEAPSRSRRTVDVAADEDRRAASEPLAASPFEPAFQLVAALLPTFANTPLGAPASPFARAPSALPPAALPARQPVIAPAPGAVAGPADAAALATSAELGTGPRRTLPSPPAAAAPAPAGARVRSVETLPDESPEAAQQAEKPVAARAQHADAQPAQPTQPAVIERPSPLGANAFALPRFIEGGRIEWSLEERPAPAIDAHRSMENAVLAAGLGERSAADQHPSHQRNDSDRQPAWQPPRAEREPLVASPVNDLRAAETFGSEPSAARDDAGSDEPRLDALSGVPMTHTPIAHAPHEPKPTLVAPPSAADDLHRFVNASGREQRQDDVETAVSRMTLSHRVEARTVLDDLGAVRVRAESIDGRVELRVTAERPETAVFLEQSRADMTRELRLTQPQVSTLSVATGGGGSDSASRHRQEPRPAPSESWAATGTPASMASASPSAPSTANGRRVRIVL